MIEQDSMSHPIKVGDKVRFRGEHYTIKEFLPGKGLNGCNALVFEEEVTGPFALELPDETAVDLVR